CGVAPRTHRSLYPLAGTVRAFAAFAATTPFADSCHLIRSDLSLLSLEFKTDDRSPEVSSTAFDTQPLDLHSVPLMDRGFAAICQLARTLPASHPVFVHRLASLLHASFRPHLAVRPLRFAITSPPSGCEEDLHLPAVGHARHTNRHRGSGRPLSPATPPDMRVRIGRFGGVRIASEQARETERIEVSDRKRGRQGR